MFDNIFMIWNIPCFFHVYALMYVYHVLTLQTNVHVYALMYVYHVQGAPYLTRYRFRYKNITAINMIKEVCLDRVTLHNLCDTKHDPIDDLLNELP